jgi:uncharacterized membrane protein
MSTGYFHLLISHFPVVGLVLFTPVFLFAFYKKKDDMLHLCCLVIFVLSLACLMAYNTGEAASERIQHLPEIPQQTIKEHEAAGEKMFWIFSATGMLAVFLPAAKIKSRGKDRWAYIVLALLLGVSLCLSVWTGYLGGKIRHGNDISGFVPQTAAVAPA